MILHLIAYEKFTEDYIIRINRVFEENQHLFVVFGEKPESNIRNVNANNVIYSIDFANKIQCAIFLIKKILKADKLIIHALFLSDMYLRLLLFLQPVAGNKYFWNIWGYDLYNAYWNRDKFVVREKLRIRFIKKIKAVGYIPDDYLFLKNNYETAAKFYLASYSYDFYYPEIDAPSETKNTINILLGNSATEECQYEEIIDKLTQFSDKEILVKCVLSYPKENDEYRNKIVRYGKDKLGDKFIPLIDFMPYEKYTELLSEIDVAIFNHNRQQALGNIASLLYLGKKVYVNPANGCKDYFEKMGAKIFSTESLSEADICKCNSKKLQAINRKVIDKFFSDQQFKERWRRIFEEDY